MNVEPTTVENATDPAIVGATPRSPGGAGHLAPAFYNTHDNPWCWDRPRRPAGFWIAHRHFDDRGELVLQMGREYGNHTGIVTNSYSRLERDGGEYFYVVRFDPISLSRRGNVSLRAFVQVNGWKPPGRELWGRTEYLGIRARGAHVFRAGYEVEVRGGGNYGEVIGKLDVDQHPLASPRSAEAAIDGEMSLEDMQKLLTGDDGAEIELVELPSFKDVVTAGLEVDEG